jgi:hypothetical protein
VSKACSACYEMSCFDARKGHRGRVGKGGADGHEGPQAVIQATAMVMVMRPSIFGCLVGGSLKDEVAAFYFGNWFSGVGS